MKPWITSLVLAASCTTAFAAPPASVQSILERVEAARPTSQDMGLYSLDWAPTLDAAAERARREARPIFLVLVTNSFGNLASGHC